MTYYLSTTTAWASRVDCFFFRPLLQHCYKKLARSPLSSTFADMSLCCPAAQSNHQHAVRDSTKYRAKPLSFDCSAPAEMHCPSFRTPHTSFGPLLCCSPAASGWRNHVFAKRAQTARASFLYLCTHVLHIPTSKVEQGECNCNHNGGLTVPHHRTLCWMPMAPTAWIRSSV